MNHVAILRKAKVRKGDDLLADILAGIKTVESRWYVNKIAPWDKIKKGEVIYFKESSGFVTAKAVVYKVVQLNLRQCKSGQSQMGLSRNESVQKVIDKYGKKIAPNTSKKDWKNWANQNTNKNYCILIFIEDVKKIQPFNINKTGFGNACAWLCVKNIDNIKV